MAQSTPRFFHADAAGRWTEVLLTVTILLAISDAISRSYFGATEGIASENAFLNDFVTRIVTLLQVLIVCLTTVSFLTWFYRVHKNLAALGVRDLDFPSEWTIGCFFVPFLNLFSPYQVMREVWHGSDPAAIERDSAPDSGRVRANLVTPASVKWWWLCFLAAVLLFNISLRIEFGNEPSSAALNVSHHASIVSDFFGIPAGALAIFLVGRVTRWQAEKYKRISSAANDTQTLLVTASGVLRPPPRPRPRDQ